MVSQLLNIINSKIYIKLKIKINIISFLVKLSCEPVNVVTFITLHV